MDELSLSVSEKFISGYHDVNPGITSEAFHDLEVFKGNDQFSSTYQCLLNLVDKDLNHSSVLDLACGDGFLLSRLATQKQSALSLFGIDISRGELAAAEKRLGDSATLLYSKSQSLKFADNSFDIVLCHMALMLMEDVDEVLLEVQRVLKQGSVFSAIIGAKSPLPACLKSFGPFFCQYNRKTELESVRFGDSRISSDEGIRELFGEHFKDLEIENLVNKRRYTAAELWAWFSGMYDLHLLDEEDASEIEGHFISSVEANLDADGKIEYVINFKQITAFSI